jgi:hypothetical protein
MGLDPRSRGESYLGNAMVPFNQISGRFRAQADFIINFKRNIYFPILFWAEVDFRAWTKC